MPVSKADIVEMGITTSILTAAHKKATAMGTRRNSITRGQGNLAGFVGEHIALKYLTGSIQAGLDNSYDYDIIYEELKIDVKTKRTGYQPLTHYDCSISDHNTKQDCDVYLFTRVKNDYSVCWLLGWLDKQEYFDLADFKEKGTVDVANGWQVASDCWNVSIEDLNAMKDLRE